jgi:hypothetical protein
MYWTDGLLHWHQWEDLIPDPSQKTVVIIIEDEWYMVPKADLKPVLKHASALRNEIAARLHVAVDEIRCVKTDESVDPMEAIQMTPHSVWSVTFEAPDWWEPVMIRVKVGDTTYRRAITKRQSLSLLEERLNDMPGRDENTLWFRPDKVKIDGTISLFEWNEEDILTVIQKTDGLIQMEMNFRHTMRGVTTPIPQVIRAAKDWVNLVWSVPRNVVQIHVSIGANEILQVQILELEHSTEQYDDIPMAYVWARIGEFRRRQYRAQRAIDV